MKLSRKMVADHLIYITSIELEDVDDPLEDMSVYDNAIDSMAYRAREDGTLDDLQMALDSLISEPSGRVSQFFGPGYPFSESELAEILTYACRRIWPGEPVSGPGEAMPVEFVSASEL